jgi:hypothetical protein
MRQDTLEHWVSQAVYGAESALDSGQDHSIASQT